MTIKTESKTTVLIRTAKTYIVAADGSTNTVILISWTKTTEKDFFKQLH